LTFAPAELQEEFMNGPLKKWTTKGSLIAVLVLACSAGVTGVSSSVSSAAPAVGHIAHVAGGVKAYKNSLDHNTKGWCTVAQGCNGQGGNEADYGTIDIVPHTYSNSGGYASAVAGPGQSHYARVTGAGLDQDTLTGCPQPGYDASVNSPYCEGPYVCYSGTCSDSVFPTNGFTSSIEVYIDPVWAAANPGQNVDWDVGLNNTSGSYLNDNGFTMCTTSASGGGFYVNLNQFGGCNPSSEELTAAGWYKFNQDFQSVGGVVNVTYTITPPSGPVWTQVVNTGEPTSGTGGPSYGWFADEDVLGLPVAKISLKKN
jgi:hypothetical protein